MNSLLPDIEEKNIFQKLRINVLANVIVVARNDTSKKSLKSANYYKVHTSKGKTYKNFKNKLFVKILTNLWVGVDCIDAKLWMLNSMKVNI